MSMLSPAVDFISKAKEGKGGILAINPNITEISTIGSLVLYKNNYNLISV